MPAASTEPTFPMIISVQLYDLVSTLWLSRLVCAPAPYDHCFNAFQIVSTGRQFFFSSYEGCGNTGKGVFRLFILSRKNIPFPVLDQEHLYMSGITSLEWYQITRTAHNQTIEQFNLKPNGSWPIYANNNSITSSSHGFSIFFFIYIHTIFFIVTLYTPNYRVQYILNVKKKEDTWKIPSEP